jgi:imidazolonepropionase-like amidohydrolase
MRSMSAVLLAAALSIVAQRAPSEPLLLVDVHVVDVVGGTLLRDRSVLVDDGRIVRIAAAEELEAPAGATVVQGGGRYLVPGLVDAHVHLRETDEDELLLLYLAHGVTTVQSMHGGPHQLALRARVASGEVLGPRIVTTGPTTSMLGVHTAAEAVRTAREQSAAGYDAVKMYGDGRNTMPAETHRALVEAAHAAGMRVVGHAARNLPFSVMLENGQDSIDHMEEIVYTDAGLSRVVAPYVELQFGRRPLAGSEELQAALPDFAAELEPEIAALARTVRAAGLVVTPTLVTFATIQAITDDGLHRLLERPELAWVHPAQRAQWTPERVRFRNGNWTPHLDFLARYLRRNHELQLALVRAFHAEGVPLLAGTDAPFDLVVQGSALHDELALLGSAGLAPLDALRAATLAPARAFGLLAESGSIAEGKRADLVLVADDPLADVAALRAVAGVVAGGRWLAREELDERLATLAGRYAGLAGPVESIVDALGRADVGAAFAAFARLEAPDARTAALLESGVNDRGYVLLRAGKLDEALAVLGRNAEVFPEAFNAWDSLGEVHMLRGEDERAVECYARSLELNPSNSNAERMIERIASGTR